MRNVSVLRVLALPACLVLSAFLSARSEAQLSCPGGFTSEVFDFTGTLQTFVLPADATQLIVRAIGAGGR